MITDAGRTFQARVMGDSSSDGTGLYAPANWIALSTDSGPVDPLHTTLPGEVTGGSMARQQATFAHTPGESVWTLVTTFVADRQVTVSKVGVYNAQTGGTLVFERLLDSPVPMELGNKLQVVQVIDTDTPA